MASQRLFEFAEVDTQEVEAVLDGRFKLLVFFNLSDTPMELIVGNHEQCLAMARQYIKMIIVEHKIHYPKYQFTTHVRPSMRAETCLTVMKTDMSKHYPTSGLHATFEVRRME